MTVKAFGKIVPKKAFKEVRALDKTYWVYTQVLDVNKLGKVRVVICYDSKDLDGEPVYQRPTPKPHPMGLQHGRQNTSRKNIGRDTKMTLKYLLFCNI